jgi:RNA polymerase sigma factor (sigma-70 family)
MSADTLDELLARLSGGDDEAAEQVFRTYEPYLRKVVRRQLPAWLRPKFDSADVVQSVWADLICGLRGAGWHFRDAEHLRAFLVKMARHRFIDRFRHHRTSAEREQPLATTDTGGLTGHEPRPSEVAQADELWQRMLHLCPPEHRPVLLLKREGRPMEEIVAETGLHEDSIRRILRRLSRQVAFGQQPAAPPAAGQS